MSNGSITPLFDDGGPDKPRYALVPITPDMAARWLSERNTSNRHMRQGKVDKYARDMVDGAWQVNNDAICFARDGRLLNGQHRLSAVVQARTTVMMLVGRNIPVTAMTVMDTGAARTAGDALGLLGHKDSVALAATAKFLILRDRNQLSSETNAEVTHSEIAAFVDAHPLISEAVGASSLRGRIQSTPTAICAAWYIVAETDGIAAADQFFTEMAELVGLRRGDPILAVVSRLRTLSSQKVRVPNRLLVDLFIRAYNTRKRGRTIKTIALQPAKGFVLTSVA